MKTQTFLALLLTDTNSQLLHQED